MHKWIKLAIVASVIGAVGFVATIVIGIYREARSADSGPAEAIVVMGAAQFDGEPSAVFRARLDTARMLYEQGAAPLIVVSGGRMAGDRFTEAEAGKMYLESLGVPEDAILMEYFATNTESSMENVADLFGPLGIVDILVVSDGFHLYRAQRYARDEGLDPMAHAAQDSPIDHGSGLEFRYVLRETGAVILHRLGLD